MELKDLPNIRLYWSPNEFYGCSHIKSCMMRQRFETITYVFTWSITPRYLGLAKLCTTNWRS
jgi:hypothetical protein